MDFFFSYLICCIGDDWRTYTNCGFFFSLFFLTLDKMPVDWVQFNWMWINRIDHLCIRFSCGSKSYNDYFLFIDPLIMFWWKSFLLFCPPNLKGLFRVLGQPWTEKPRLVIPLNSRSKKSSPVSWIFSFSFPSVHFHIFGLCLLLWLYSSWPSTSCFSFPFFYVILWGPPTWIDRFVCQAVANTGLRSGKTTQRIGIMCWESHYQRLASTGVKHICIRAI